MYKESETLKIVRARIIKEYVKNPKYTFTTEEFIDLTTSRKDRQSISTYLSRLAVTNYQNQSPALKIVGKAHIPGKRGTINVYNVIRLPLAIKRTKLLPKPTTKPLKVEKYRAPPPPSPMLDLHNILFSMKTNSNQGD